MYYIVYVKPFGGDSGLYIISNRSFAPADATGRGTGGILAHFILDHSFVTADATGRHRVVALFNGTELKALTSEQIQEVEGLKLRHVPDSVPDMPKFISP